MKKAGSYKSRPGINEQQPQGFVLMFFSRDLGSMLILLARTASAKLRNAFDA
jgi:hypothetical protein